MNGRRSGSTLFVALMAIAGGAGLGALAGGCARSQPLAPDIVARIGGSEVHYSEFERYVARTIGDADKVLASEVLSQLFDQFLDEALLGRLARDRKLAPAVQGEANERRAIEALLGEGLRNPPAAPEIESYYTAHPAEFTRPERVRLRQILTEDRKTADRVWGELHHGGDFAALARRYSRDPSAASGGYQGELARTDLPPSFADTIFALRPGEASRPVAADYGFHIFEVVERIPAGVLPLAAARAEIEPKLRQERADQLLKSLVNEARGRYHIEVYERNLPFGYEGAYLDAHAKKAG